jgi:membrane protein required for colicin V production
MDELFSTFNDPAGTFGKADLIFGIYLLFGFIRGMFRGLPRELAGLLGTVVSVFVAWKYYAPVSAFIRAHTRVESETGSTLLAYILLMLVLFIAWKTITFLLKKTLDWTCPHQLKRWGGGLLGTAKHLLVLSVVLTVVLLSGEKELTDPLIDHSALGRATQQVVPGFLHRAMPAFFPPPVSEPGDGKEPEDLNEPAEPGEVSDGPGDA